MSKSHYQHMKERHEDEKVHELLLSQVEQVKKGHEVGDIEAVDIMQFIYDDADLIDKFEASVLVGWANVDSNTKCLEDFLDGVLYGMLKIQMDAGGFMSKIKKKYLKKEDYELDDGYVMADSSFDVLPILIVIFFAVLLFNFIADEFF